MKNNGVDVKSKYNQVANFTYLDTQVNKAISDDAPNVYFGRVLKQCESGILDIGNIADKDKLMINMAQNALPEDVVTMTVDDYDRFLTERRKLMASIIKKYYKGL